MVAFQVIALRSQLGEKSGEEAQESERVTGELNRIKAEVERLHTVLKDREKELEELKKKHIEDMDKALKVSLNAL